MAAIIDGEGALGMLAGEFAGRRFTQNVGATIL